MPFPPQRRRFEDKVAEIFGQLSSVRRRLNLLALQHAVFLSLALMLGAGALFVLAAFLFGPLWFLVAAVLLGAGLIAGLAAAIRKALAMRVSPPRAAAIADARAGLKGRLTTLVALTGRDERLPLWPYLVEDTLSLSEEFRPARIERRRLSRSVYAFLASCLLAAMVAPLLLMPRRATHARNGPAAEMEVPLDDLEIRPDDQGAGGSDAEVSADPETMRRLGEKAAAAGLGEGGAQSALSRLTAEAQNLAGALQEKITGRKHAERARIKLKLAEALDNDKNIGREDPQTGERRRGSEPGDGGGGVFDKLGRLPSDDEPAPEFDNSPERRAAPESGALGPAKPLAETARSSGASQGDSQTDSAKAAGGRDQGGGGAAHGAGVDPEHLFGKAAEPKLAAESFEITINARPSGSGASAGSRSYLPPRIRANLSPSQHPDEPIVRGEVPAEDRATIKRVFER